MKEFFKFLLASFLGTFAAVIFTLVFFFVLLIIFISALQVNKKETIASNTVLEIKLDYPVAERTMDNPLEVINFRTFSFKTPLGLNGILANIKKAKDDSNIEGIYLNLNNFDAGGLPTIEAIRNELLEFKKSGKFIYAFGINIGQKAYYLASVANKVYIQPTGIFDFRGLAVETFFFKNTLDKLDIEAQVFQHGKFKSATEPFRLDKMSDDNRVQVTDLLNSIYDHMINNLSRVRNLPAGKLKEISDGLLIHNAKDAYNYKLVDSLVYEDQVIDHLKHRSGIEADKKLRMISIQDYDEVKARGNTSKNRIAVVYAVGEIMSSSGDDENIGITNISEALRTARLDKNVKAIVLRVNSPGGDAITSDEIWREVFLAKKAKPLIVSMGDVAASGGYYISCAADTIVAEPNTITGSIGVFGIIPNFQKFFNNKLGITFDGVKTGKFSDMIPTTRPLTPEEKQIIQNEVEGTYTTFVERVSEGRHMKSERVDELGQGRIWSGLQAKQNGLVDVIGGLKEAVAIAAGKAKLKNYVVVEYPRMKQFLESILGDISTETGEAYLKAKLGENYRYYNYLQQVKNLKGIQMRLPFRMDVY